MNNKILHCFLISLFFFATKSFSCTTFLISGKYTSDGKPILFKNRDTKQNQNALYLFSDGKYRYIGLVNGDDTWDKMVWGGYNEAGFAIINSAGCNNNIGDTSKFIDQEGVIMKLALQNCKTLQDFEQLLDTLKKPMGLDSNFGVIDAYGGCAYYETGNYDYKKYDANDPQIAPNGIIVRTNYSERGALSEGYGFCRYNTAVKALTELSIENKLIPRELFNNISRNLTHSITNTDLRKELPGSKDSAEFKFFVDFIPRYSTSSAIMIVGANNEKNASNTMMWSILGFPLTSIALPVWIKTAHMPKALKLDHDLTSAICNTSLHLKKECFPVTYDRQWRYINLSKVINKNKTGIMQLLSNAEDKIFDKAQIVVSKIDKGKFSENELIDFYKWLDDYLETETRNLFGVELFKE